MSKKLESHAADQREVVEKSRIKVLQYENEID